jgi:nucleotide-binding universal stress UspA family protein
MLRTILVGLDGSPLTSSVVTLGIAWARRFDALLVAIGVVDEPALCGAHTAPPGGYLEKLQQEWIGRARNEVETLLEQLAIRCAEERVACKLLEDSGTPCEQILKEAQRFDLIMLGKHAHFEAQKDSCRTLPAVLRHALRPVVAVPETLPTREGPVLVAYDGSLQAARALQLFAMSGLGALGDVHVLSADPTDPVEAARTADRAVQFLSSHGVAATPLARLHTGSAAQAILEQASALSAQLIVMGCYGRPRWEEFLIGSTTKSVIAESPVPVFLYH